MSTQSSLAATIEVVGAIVSPGGELRYRITNTGSVELICGLAHRLELAASDGWIQMNRCATFRAIGFAVPPGGYLDLPARIPADVPAGVYRLSTSVSSDHVEGSVPLFAGFDVVRNS